MIKLFIAFTLVVFANDTPSSSQARYDQLMKIWNELTFENRDNFLSQIKGVTSKESEQGDIITENEYNKLIALSKKSSIPEFKLVDSHNRPKNLDERRNIIQETCESFKGKKYDKCQEKWFAIVEHTSEDGDSISDKEWDEFQELVKQIKKSK